MVALIVVGMVVAFLVIDLVLHARRQPSVAAQVQRRLEESAAGPARRVAGFRIAPDASFHPGHTWARHLGRGMARVGVDDFALRLVGRPDRIDAPPVGTVVRAGRPLLTLVRKGRRTSVLAPVSGAVAAVNKDALNSPASITSDPYGEGWIVDLKSADLAYDFRSLLSGEMARRFLDEAAGTLHAFFTPGLAAAAADGGEALDGIGDTMDDQTWDRVRSRFLLTDPE